MNLLSYVLLLILASIIGTLVGYTLEKITRKHNTHDRNHGTAILCIHGHMDTDDCPVCRH